MLTIQRLKEQIENKAISDDMIIFVVGKESTFIPHQYIHEISEIRDLPISYVEENDLNDLVNPVMDIFGMSTTTIDLKVAHVDTLKYIDGLAEVKNLIVVCSKVDKQAEEWYNGYMVTVPPLEQWQIKDYMYSVCDGAPEDRLDYIIRVSNSDMFRLEKEAQKIALFGKEERKTVVDNFIKDGIFSDLSDKTIFDLSNALVQKDTKKLCQIYKELDNMDVEPIGLWTVLYKNIRSIILVQLQPCPTEENTELSSKQIYAIRKNNCGIYTKEQLERAFGFLADIDRKIKVGDMPMEILLDYLIAFMLQL